MEEYIIKYESDRHAKENIIDVNNLNWEKIKKSNTFSFCVDIASLSRAKKKEIVKKILKLKRKALKKNIDIGIIDDTGKKVVAYIYNYDSKNLEHKDFINAINAILKNNKREMYSYIYDNVCDYLDSQFYRKKYL